MGRKDRCQIAMAFSSACAHRIHSTMAGSRNEVRKDPNREESSGVKKVIPVAPKVCFEPSPPYQVDLKRLMYPADWPANCTQLPNECWVNVLSHFAWTFITNRRTTDKTELEYFTPEGDNLSQRILHLAREALQKSNNDYLTGIPSRPYLDITVLSVEAS
jgi:hypothetical protein